MSGVLMAAGGSAATPLTVGVTSTSLAGYCNNGELTTDPCTTAAVYATGLVSGGFPPYAYLWQNVSGDAATLTASTSVTTGFTRSGGTPASLSGIYRLRVTDNVGTIAYSPNVTIATTHENLL